MESIGEETAGPLELLLLLINPADILETFRTCNGQKLHIMENSIYVFFHTKFKFGSQCIRVFILTHSITQNGPLTKINPKNFLQLFLYGLLLVPLGYLIFVDLVEVAGISWIFFGPTDKTMVPASV